MQIIGAISFQTKEFRLEGLEDRTISNMEIFIKKYIEPGNNIITDFWPAYNFLNYKNDYNRIRHVHKRWDFGLGVDSILNIESLWNILKLNIKSCYYIIPNKDLIKFLGEAEIKYNLRHKTNNEKIALFFEVFWS